MNNYDYKYLTPFKWFILENFPFIEADFDALTNWQLFCKLGKEMNKIIDSTNLTGEQVENLTNAFNELKNYVNNFFTDLNVQEEINNKLDEMAESGQLAEIINQEIFGEITSKLNKTAKYYNTLNEMLQDDTVKENEKLIVLGNESLNDYGKNIYIATSETTNIILQNNLFAKKINDSYMLSNIEVKQFYDNTIPCRYYITTIPHLDNLGTKVELKVGTAEDISSNYGTVESNVDFSKRKKADISINSARFNTTTNIPLGSIIRDGQIIKDTVVTETGTEYLGIDENGKFHFYPANSTSANNMLSQGIKQAILGWYSLMVDGVLTTQGQDTEVLQPRQIIGQDENLNVFILTTDGRSLRNLGMSLNQCATILHNNYNCNNIYSLDGGGSTSTVIYQNKINEDIDGNTQVDRKIPVFLYVKSYNTDNELANNLFAMNKINSEIIDVFKDKTLPIINILGDFKYYTSTITDASLPLKNGLYYCGSNTSNTPGVNGFLLHLTWMDDYQTTQKNARQYYIPVEPNGNIFYREQTSGGTWGAWMNPWRKFISPAGSSQQRPTTNLVGGIMFWDWTLQKPIWWNNSTNKWIDAMGNPV